MKLFDHLKGLTNRELNQFLRKLIFYSTSTINDRPEELEIEEKVTERITRDSEDGYGYQQSQERKATCPGFGASETLNNAAASIFFDCGGGLHLKLVRNVSDNINLESRKPSVFLVKWGRGEWKGEDLGGINLRKLDLPNSLSDEILKRLSSLAVRLYQLRNEPCADEQEIIDKITTQERVAYSQERLVNREREEEIFARMKAMSELGETSWESSRVITRPDSVAPARIEAATTESQEDSASAYSTPMGSPAPQRFVTLTTTSNGRITSQV